MFYLLAREIRGFLIQSLGGLLKFIIYLLLKVSFKPDKALCNNWVFPYLNKAKVESKLISIYQIWG